MGCTSAKQVSAVPSDEDGRGKAFSNGDLYSDEYKMKGVEEVKYMRGDENRVNARNQENLEKSNVECRGKQQKEAAATSIKSNIHTSESQQEFFRMLDEKIEKGARLLFGGGGGRRDIAHRPPQTRPPPSRQHN